MNDSPASILFNSDGYEVSKNQGELIDGYSPGLLIGGVDQDSKFSTLKIINEALSVINKPQRNVVGKYFSTSTLINGNAVAQNLFTIENPIGSGRSIYINQIDVNGMSTANFSTPFLYSVTRLVGLPTGGTVTPAQKRKTSDLSPSAIIRQLPTATLASGALWVGSAGIVANGYTNRPKTELSFVTEDESFEILISEGESICVVAAANSVNWRHYINIRWSES